MRTWRPRGDLKGGGSPSAAAAEGYTPPALVRGLLCHGSPPSSRSSFRVTGGNAFPVLCLPGQGSVSAFRGSWVTVIMTEARAHEGPLSSYHTPCCLSREQNRSRDTRSLVAEGSLRVSARPPHSQRRPRARLVATRAPLSPTAAEPLGRGAGRGRWGRMWRD